MRMPWFAALFGLALSLSACDAASPSLGVGGGSLYAVDEVFKDAKAQDLAIAAEHGDTAEIQRLMKQEHVNPDRIFSEDDSGMPLVAWPVFTHNPDGLKAMLDNGANPNARKPGTHTKHYSDGSGGTYFDYDNAMVWAAKQEDPIYLKLLLDHGGDPNTRNGNDETLLFQAFIWHNQWKNVQLLVERGADINAKSAGSSILSNYAFSGQFEKTYWLLQHGADPTEGQGPPSASPEPYQYPIIEGIFWGPGNPDWQRKCQQWLLQHGYRRLPITPTLRDRRKAFGLPYKDEDLPKS